LNLFFDELLFKTPLAIFIGEAGPMSSENNIDSSLSASQPFYYYLFLLVFSLKI
jgi:hypothetical protein